MTENIVVPALGESITEATVSKWIKNQGDQVRIDEPIVELETDKVNVEVPSPAEGIISKINFKTGAKVEVGALLGTISSRSDKVISREKVVPITKSTNGKIPRIVSSANSRFDLEESQCHNFFRKLRSIET